MTLDNKNFIVSHYGDLKYEMKVWLEHFPLKQGGQRKSLPFSSLCGFSGKYLICIFSLQMQGFCNVPDAVFIPSLSLSSFSPSLSLNR